MRVMTKWAIAVAVVGLLMGGAAPSVAAEAASEARR